MTIARKDIKNAKHIPLKERFTALQVLSNNTDTHAHFGLFNGMFMFTTNNAEL